MAHPELNASAIARRMGISQGLMMQYISGAKQPDEQHTQLIYDTIRTVGHELAALQNAQFVGNAAHTAKHIIPKIVKIGTICVYLR